MRNWKRIVALLMAATLTLGAVGCGSGGGEAEGGSAESKEAEGGSAEGDAASGDMKTVGVHIPRVSNFTDEGIANVEAEINKILAERYGVQLKLNYIDLGNWTQQTNLALTTDEVDVIAILNSPLAAFVNNGQLEPLDGYIAEASAEFNEIFSPEDLMATTFDGQVYSLPRKWWDGQESALFMSEKVIEEMDIDPQSIDSIEKVDELLYQVKEKYPDMYALVPGVEPSKLMDVWYFGDGMADERGRYGVVPMFDEDFDVNNIQTKSVFETDAFMEICSYAYKWYNDGLVLPDVLSNSISGGTYIQNGEAFAFIVRQQGNGYKAPAPLTDNIDSIPSASLGPSIAYSNINNVVSYGISSNSANKDASWTVLQALYTDPDVSTLLTDGIKDVNYTEEDGVAQFMEGEDTTNTTYGGLHQFWTYPNPLNSLPSPFMGAEFKEQATAYADFAEPSPIVGFQWDYSEVEDEMAAVSKIYDEYYVPLISGLLDPVETIPVVVEELEAAGMGAITESQTTQLKEFMETK